LESVQIETMAAPSQSGNNVTRRRGPLAAPRNELEGVLGNLLEDNQSVWHTQMGLINPSLDITETESTLKVRMDLPGLDAKDIDLQVSGNQLTIAGERKEEKVTKNEYFHRTERRIGCFSRSFTLPCAVKEDKIEADYRDGLLNITLPKTDEAKSRRIHVKAQ